MSTAMIIVAVIVFFATRHYMTKQCEAQKRKLAHDMITRLMLVEDLSIPQDREHFCYREAIDKLNEAEDRAYVTAENLYFNSISPAAYYRFRDELEKNAKYERLLTAIKAQILTPEQRERYQSLKKEYIPEKD
ncbi:hypothetical protein TUM12370_15080 [Salmonella enterica subsp. enterica serovar Choleraesuis]|nr:hypothetical protein TUM12370_15080 [Salmonella enterica subsp. enterica serovar Choleraesuis]